MHLQGSRLALDQSTGQSVSALQHSGQPLVKEIEVCPNLHTHLDRHVPRPTDDLPEKV